MKRSWTLNPRAVHVEDASSGCSMGPHGRLKQLVMKKKQRLPNEDNILPPLPACIQDAAHMAPPQEFSRWKVTPKRNSQVFLNMGFSYVFLCFLDGFLMFCSVGFFVGRLLCGLFIHRSNRANTPG